MRLKLQILLLILPFVQYVSGQMTPEKVYDYSLTSTRISGSEYKYYLMDVGNSQCRIYNRIIRCGKPSTLLFRQIITCMTSNL